MDRRSFLKSVLGIGAGVLVAPKLLLKTPAAAVEVVEVVEAVPVAVSSACSGATALAIAREMSANWEKILTEQYPFRKVLQIHDMPFKCKKVEGLAMMLPVQMPKPRRWWDVFRIKRAA